MLLSPFVRSFWEGLDVSGLGDELDYLDLIISKNIVSEPASDCASQKKKTALSSRRHSRGPCSNSPGLLRLQLRILLGEGPHHAMHNGNVLSSDVVHHHLADFRPGSLIP